MLSTILVGFRIIILRIFKLGNGALNDLSRFRIIILRMPAFYYSCCLQWLIFLRTGGSWLSRSVFVVEGYVLVCIEDFVQFSSLTNDVGVSSPYFSLDLCCPIRCISEMVYFLHLFLGILFSHIKRNYLTF